MLEALKACVLERQGAETREVTEAIGVPLKLAKLLEERVLLDESQQPVLGLGHLSDPHAHVGQYEVR